MTHNKFTYQKKVSRRNPAYSYPKVTYNHTNMTYSDSKVTHSDPTHLPLPPPASPDQHQANCWEKLNIQVGGWVVAGNKHYCKL